MFFKKEIFPKNKSRYLWWYNVNFQYNQGKTTRERRVVYLRIGSCFVIVGMCLINVDNYVDNYMDGKLYKAQ